jgi:hypothetical protein
MFNKEWRRRNEGWKKFEDWKKKQSSTQTTQVNIHLIGEIVDFYLTRNPKIKKKLLKEKNYEGIKRLHRNLSLWRMK